jgi:hypothetical protein
MQATNRIRKILTALSVVLVTVALIGAAVWHPTMEPVPTSPVVESSVQAPVIGVATGEYQNGAPVYRMPSIAVTMSRSEVLARMAREDAVAMK